jgi:hypothetical protein
VQLMKLRKFTKKSTAVFEIDLGFKEALFPIPSNSMELKPEI